MMLVFTLVLFFSLVIVALDRTASLWTRPAPVASCHTRSKAIIYTNEQASKMKRVLIFL